MKTYKISPYQVLPLGKVGPIEMRQLARGHIDERLVIMVRHRRIIKGYGCIFIVIVLATLSFLVLLAMNLIGLIIVTIFGAARELTR
jgi:hypothetical protein